MATLSMNADFEDSPVPSESSAEELTRFSDSSDVSSLSLFLHS